MLCAPLTVAFCACELDLACRDGGRPVGLLNTASPATEARCCARLGIDRLEESTEVLFELVFAAGGTIDDRARDVLEDFFCSDGGGG